MIEERTFLNEIDMLKFDEEIDLVPLYWDSFFKSLFTSDLNLLKRFVVSQISDVIDLEDCTIRLLNNELPKEKNFESKITVDIYVNINNSIYLDIEINTERYKNIEGRNILFLDKLHTLIFKSGTKYKNINDTKLIQLNINANEHDNKFGKDVLVTYGIHTKNIYQNNKYTVLENLVYYRNLYYNEDVILEKSELWLVMLTSKNFIELYKITSKIFTIEERDKFIRRVKDMCSLEEFSIHEWEKEKMDELVRQTMIANGKAEGRVEGKAEGRVEGRVEGKAEGIRENQINVVKNMLKDGFDNETISRISNLSIEEIVEIKESL